MQVSVPALVRGSRWLGIIVLSVGWALASRADEVKWDTLPGGVLGRVATFEGVGGVTIAGYVRRPAGTDRCPIVIVLHGGTPTAHPPAADGAGNVADHIAAEALRASEVLGRSHNPPLPDFLAQGWAVYTIDFRPNPRYMIDAYEWDDTLVAVKQAKAFPFVDPQRVAIYGGSHGAHLVARVIARTDFTCAVLCAPAGLDLIELSRAAARGVKIGANQRLIREYEQRTHHTMAEIAKDPASVDYTSPLTEVARVRCPILLISGKNDPNAPLPVMDEYVDKARAAGHSVETYHPDNGPHGFYVGLPHVIPETAVATQRAVAFIRSQFAAAKPSPDKITP